MQDLWIKKEEVDRDHIKEEEVHHRTHLNREVDIEERGMIDK